MTKVNRGRRMVNKEQDYIGDFDGYTLIQVREQIDKLIAQYGEDATISMEYQQYSDSDQKYAYVYKEVPETDEEMATRITQEEQYAKQREAYERAEFERLQAKFGEK